MRFGLSVNDGSSAQSRSRSDGNGPPASTISLSSPDERNSYGAPSGSLTGASCARKFTDGRSASSTRSAPDTSSYIRSTVFCMYGRNTRFSIRSPWMS